MNDDETRTFRDGVGIERCGLCGRAIRDLADEPLLYVRRVDVVEAARALATDGAAGFQPDLARRLAQALGLGLEQLFADEEGYGHGV